MDGPSFLEEPLLGTIDSQLSEAVADLDNVSNEELDPITRQKLILDAVHELGVGNHVTTQYYLHGDVAVKGKESNRSGKATLQLPRGLNSDIPSADRIYSHFVEDRREYVTRALKTETFEWLREYYEGQDDFPFRDVYLSGLPIYSSLHNIRSAVIEQNPNLMPVTPKRTISEHSPTLKRSLTRYPIFQDILPYVTEFEKASGPALEWIESKDWGCLNENILEYYDFVDFLYQLFYEGVWKAIGQQMSYNTVEGPSAPSTRDRREREMKDQNFEFQLKFDRLEMESDTPGVAIDADVDRLPDLEPVELGAEPVISESDLEEVPQDDPAFSLLN